ncbi:MAG: hypothetical protein M3Y53_10510 [Thermoproteota archaeon]|nr:hypothetical protein [Thermoproteota archaeon]
MPFITRHTRILTRSSHPTSNQEAGLCIDNELWPWLRKKKIQFAEVEQKYYIDGSILELFSRRLPNLDIKKLGEKTGLKYSQEWGGRRVFICTKKELTNFIEGNEIDNPKLNTSHGKVESF